MWECTAYSSSRATFTERLQELLGDSYAVLSNIEKATYVLGSEHWRRNFKFLLFLVKQYILDIWKLENKWCTVAILSWGSGRGGVTGVDGQRISKLDKSGKSDNVNVPFGVHVCVLVCVAPPMVLSVWLMAGALQQLFEWFRSGTHSLNEVGIEGDREGKLECTLCGAESEIVVHVLWECYSSSRARFIVKNIRRHIAH